jgi:two-component system, NarL family, sensor histidine kinase DegS
MIDASAGGQHVNDRLNPTARLRQLLQTRITLIEAEIDSFEQRDADLQAHIKECRQRRDSADAIRQPMLQGISDYGPEEIRSAFDDYTAAIAEVARGEQRFRELTDHRVVSEERLQTLRADLELVSDSADDAGTTVPPEGSSSFRSASRQVFQVIEEERMRIARDMHDGPAQSMSNLVLQAEIIERLANRPDALLVELQDFKNSVRIALDEVRRLIFDLRPMTLDDLGLVPTLRKFTAEYTKKHGIQTRLSAAGGERRLPANIEGTLFRIVQEALTNVHKHSGAQNVEVNLVLTPERVSASVRDDGHGFDLRTVEARVTQNRNLGLVIMRERCELEHGVFEIRSKPGKGTEIRAEFRLE